MFIEATKYICLHISLVTLVSGYCVLEAISSTLNLLLNFYYWISIFRQAYTHSLLLFWGKIYQIVDTYWVLSTYLLKGTNKDRCTPNPFGFHINCFGQFISAWIIFFCLNTYFHANAQDWRRNTNGTNPAALLVSSAAYIALVFADYHVFTDYHVW